MDSSLRNTNRGASWLFAIGLAVAGLIVSIELTRIHIELQIEPSHRSFCNISASVNCDAVSASSYSVLFGLPLSVWGILGYLATGIVATWGLRSTRAAARFALWLLGAAFLGGAVSLALVSALVLKTWCLLCMVTWTFDLGLFVVATSLVRDHGLKATFFELLDWLRGNTTQAVSWCGIGLLAVAGAYRIYPDPGDALSAPARAASLTQQTPDAGDSVFEGADQNGLYYTGAKNPKTTIVEFSDFQCPHCARAHEQLSALVRAYPNAIRVVHRQFPLDNDCNPRIGRPFHRYSCYYAKLSVCAASLGRFRRANDFLFAHGRDEVSVAVESLARAVDLPAEAVRDCLKNKADTLLRRDIDDGMKAEIDGTPTFIIDGTKHTGELPAEVLRTYPLEKDQ